MSEEFFFYDPLISKLSAWGADRAEAIARMKRALAEDEVLGIRTTIPFFRWFLQQPAFEAGAFHTGTLDELLQQRQGEPFVIPTEDERQIAALAAEAYASRRKARPHADLPASGASGAASAGRASLDRPKPGGWKRQGRLEGLRSDS